MHRNRTPRIKVPYGIDNLVFSWTVIAIVVYIAGLRNFSQLTQFIIDGGWIALVCWYVYYQFYSSTWILYEDRLIVKRPWRPFYNRFEFSLENIQEVKFMIPIIGKLNPSIVVRCHNKRFERYDFGFTGDVDKMNKLLAMLSERNIKVETKKIG